MPGLVKLGFTSKPPSQRAQQLEGTGVPHPFTVEYHALVANARDIEQAAHKLLAERRESKEFFRVSVVEAMAAIRSALATVGASELSEADSEPTQDDA